MMFGNREMTKRRRRGEREVRRDWHFKEKFRNSWRFHNISKWM
jgi:hypothetical protein